MPDASDIEVDEKPLANPYIKAPNDEERKQRRLEEWKKFLRQQDDKKQENKI